MFLSVVVVCFFSSCSSEEISSSKNLNEKENVFVANLSTVQDTTSVKNAFNAYATMTRSLGIKSTDDSYDFTNVYVGETYKDNTILYMVSSKEQTELDKLLVGVGNDDGINLKLYFEETSKFIYTLYNQDDEAICEMKYDEDSGTIECTKVYESDVSVIPTRISRQTYSKICNGAFVVGGIGLMVIGALPTMGASIGFAVCTYVISSALC